jgi:chemotaxis protein methyltransferase CheR
VNDAECVLFLQWALPRLGLRWQGFRKVRRQVCRRIGSRLEHLGLADVAAYRAFLETHAEEWAELDGLCHVTISRFYRDRGVFAFLEQEALPALARNAVERGDAAVRAWSAGCASGEEPYSLALLWELVLAEKLPGVGLTILATDVDEPVLARARVACYPESSLRELPERWRARGFVERAGLHCLRDDVKRRVRVARHDVRTPAPDGPFDLILCRNLAFTYFDEVLQRRVCSLLAAALVPGGALVLGRHETLPAEAEELEPWRRQQGVYRRIADARPGCIRDDERNNTTGKEAPWQ